MRFENWEVSNSADIHKKRGEHVKAFQERYGLTNKAVAEILHCSESRVSMMRSGERPVVTEDAERLAKMFPDEGIRPEYFLCTGRFPDCMTESELFPVELNDLMDRRTEEHDSVYKNEKCLSDLLLHEFGIQVVTAELNVPISVSHGLVSITDDEQAQFEQREREKADDNNMVLFRNKEDGEIVAKMTYNEWADFADEYNEIVDTLVNHFVKRHKSTEEDLKEWQTSESEEIKTEN